MTKQINKRQLSNYQVQLLIAQNPHTKNPQNLVDMLKKQEAEIESIDQQKKEEFDAVGFENLKSAMGMGTGIKIKS